MKEKARGRWKAGQVKQGGQEKNESSKREEKEGEITTQTQVGRGRKTAL